MFDKVEDLYALAEGRFLPVGAKQEFKFEDAGYEVPQGGVLYFKGGKFDMDLSGAQVKSFSLSAYSSGQLAGKSIVSQLGKSLQIVRTSTGFDVIGDASIINPFNKIVSKGEISVDFRGMLSRVGKGSDVLLYPATLKFKPGKELKTASAPQDVLRLRAYDEDISFSLCKKVDPEEPSVNVCATKAGKLRIESKNVKGSTVAHLRAYAAKKDESLADIIKELKPAINSRLRNRFVKSICNYNQDLKARDESCGVVKAGEDVYVESLLLGPKKTSLAALELDEALDKVSLESGSADVTSLGATFSVDAETGVIKMPAIHITAGEVDAHQAKIAKLIAQSDMSKAIAAYQDIINDVVHV